MLCHVFWSQVEYKIVCFIKETVSNFQGLLSHALALSEKSTQCRSCVKENYKILKAGCSEMNISGVESTQNSNSKVQVKSSASKIQESHSASSTQGLVIGVRNANVQNQNVNMLDDNKESKNESLPPKLPALSLKEKDDSAADFPLGDPSLGVFIQKDNLESIREGKTSGLYINRLVEVVFDHLDFSRYRPAGNGKFTDGTKLLKLTDTNKYKAIKQFAISKFGHETLIGLISTRSWTLRADKYTTTEL